MAGKRLTGERAFHRVVVLFAISIVVQCVLIFGTNIPLADLQVASWCESGSILAYGFVMVWQLERRKS